MSYKECREILVSFRREVEDYRNFGEEKWADTERKGQELSQLLAAQALEHEEKSQALKKRYDILYTWFDRINPFNRHTHRDYRNYDEARIEQLQIRKLAADATKIQENFSLWNLLPEYLKSFERIHTKLSNASADVSAMLMQAPEFFGSPFLQAIDAYLEVEKLLPHNNREVSSELANAALFAGVPIAEIAKVFERLKPQFRSLNTEEIAALLQAGILGEKSESEILDIFDAVRLDPRISRTNFSAPLAQAALLSRKSANDAINAYNAFVDEPPQLNTDTIGAQVQLMLLFDARTEDLKRVYHEFKIQLPYRNDRTYGLLTQIYFLSGKGVEDILATYKEIGRHLRVDDEIAAMIIFASREFVPVGREKEASLLSTGVANMLRHLRRIKN
jgi:hypothetical protein